VTSTYAGTGELLSLRGWFEEAEAAAGIARQLADTPFVPDSLKRWQPLPRNAPRETPRVLDADATVAIVSAALLAGQELGFGPMAALRSFDVIRGVPALRANALRALVQHHGHDLTVVESTATRAVVRGRRSNGETQQSTWTLDRARQMGLYPGKEDGQWRRQPQNMLVARASAEAARWIASDAILGMPYIAEELADEPYETAPAAELEAAPAPARRAKRRTAVGRVNAPPPPALPAPAPVVSGTVVEGTDGHIPPGEPVPRPREPAPDEGPPLINRAQLAKLHARLRAAGLGDAPGEALRRMGEWIGREITTTKQLTAAEANTVLGHLTEAAEEADAAAAERADAEAGGDANADDG
jgi:hypothetical protein